MDCKLPLKKVIASGIVFIMIILLGGFSDTYAYSNENGWVYVIKCIVCLSIILVAIVFGKLYENINCESEIDNDC